MDKAGEIQASHLFFNHKNLSIICYLSLCSVKEILPGKIVLNGVKSKRFGNYHS